MKTNIIKLSSPATREFWEIPVLMEDEHLLALDKPARLPTVGDPAEPERPNLLQLLHDGIKAKKPWVVEHHLSYLNNAHRLDADVTGVWLLAKNKQAAAALADWFGTERAGRKFFVVARGTPEASEFEIDEPIAPHPVREGLMRVDAAGGKKSKTRVKVVEDYSQHGFALLQCEPLTDRPHQIRVHLRHAGLTVAGDQLYGGKPLWLSRLKRDYRLKPGHEERPLISRAAIHSCELTVAHPITRETILIKSELPKDMRVGLKYLRQYSGMPVD